MLKANPDSPVVIDEAYVDFGAESAVKLIDTYPNLLVVQTVSKARSLAGMRVGFAFGDAALIEALTRVKDSFNSYPLDRLAQAAAIAAYEDDAWFRDSCAQGDCEPRAADRGTDRRSASKSCRRRRISCSRAIRRTMPRRSPHR